MCSYFIHKISLFISLILLASCAAESSKPIIMTSSFPVASIIRELTGNKIGVEVLVPAGASPHTYAPKPSDIKNSSRALAFFSVAPNYDGWSRNIKSKLHFELISFLPDSLKSYFGASHVHEEGTNHSKMESNSSVDPHFWLDPMAVKAIIPALADTLAKISPEIAGYVKKNSDLFIKRLDLIDIEVKALTANLYGKPLFLQHPSMIYFAKRYNLEYMGSIEEVPGKEPGPKFIAELANRIKSSGTKAIFTEPQLNRKAAEVIAKSANVFLYELDPIGGTEKIRNYSDLILVNAKVLGKALSNYE